MKFSKFKKDILRFFFFCFLFCSLCYSPLFTDYFPSDYIGFTESVMDINLGYNNLWFIPGIVVTVLCAVSTNRIAYLRDSSFVVQKGKHGYMKYFFSRAVLNAFLISAEFVGAEVVICTIRYKNALLLDTGFYQCCALYMLSLFGYFAIVGITQVLMTVVVNFNNISCVLTIVLLCGLSSLHEYRGLDISPVYFSNFISAWFQQGTFDWLIYVLHLLICLCVVFALFYIANIIFQRKDLIFNEQKD